MRVHEVMSRPVETCHRSTNLAEVVTKMWKGDCGVVPVVDGAQRLVGLLTDRDICIALATRHRRADELTAGEVMRERVITVEPHQDVKEAMQVMARERIRRLPVLGEDRRVVGLLSVNDLILHVRSRTRTGSEPAISDLLETLQAICAHPQPVALVASPSPLKAQV